MSSDDTPLWLFADQLSPRIYDGEHAHREVLLIESTSALGRRESKVYEDIINGGRYAFLTAPAVEGLLEGGVPIMKDGQCLGAVGVSGVKSSEDAQIARAGIAALGL